MSANKNIDEVIPRDPQMLNVDKIGWQKWREAISKTVKKGGFDKRFLRTWAVDREEQLINVGKVPGSFEAEIEEAAEEPSDEGKAGEELAETGGFSTQKKKSLATPSKRQQMQQLREWAESNKPDDDIDEKDILQEEKVFGGDYVFIDKFGCEDSEKQSTMRAKIFTFMEETLVGTTRRAIPVRCISR